MAFNFNYQEKMAILNTLLKIMLVDGEKAHQEEQYLNDIKNAFDINDQQMGEAKELNPVLRDQIFIKMTEETLKDSLRLMIKMITADKKIQVEEIKIVYDICKETVGIPIPKEMADIIIGGLIQELNTSEKISPQSDTDDEQKNEKEAQSLQIGIDPDVLQKLEQNGLVAQNPLKWLKSKSLFAYFVDVYTEKYSKDHKHGDKKKLKPFEILFGIDDIKGRINDYKNKTGSLPIGYKTIDDILK